MKTDIKFIRYVRNDPKQKKEICFYSDGDKHWFLNGEYHREGGPAVEYSDGEKFWLLNGYAHREDGPACEYSDGTKHWYLNGNRFLSEIDYWEVVEKYNKDNKIK